MTCYLHSRVIYSATPQTSHDSIVFMVPKEVHKSTHRAAIINRSLAEGVMPSSLKCAAVTPLLKKAGMDEEDMRRYRAMCNLPFSWEEGQIITNK